MSESATWCGQCYAPAGGAGPGASPGRFGAGSVRPATTATRLPLAPEPVRAPAIRTSRWRKTPTTFGPVGRVVATVFLVVPLLVFVVLGVVGDPMCLGGAVVWGLIIMPWGLRDTWRAGTVRPG